MIAIKLLFAVAAASFIVEAGASFPCANAADSFEQQGAATVALAKETMGGTAWDQVCIWHERGQFVSRSGEAGQYEHWGDFRTLSVRNKIVNSGKVRYMVFDGVASWDSTNPNFTPKTPIDVNVARNGSYMADFGFFFSNRFPASFRYRGLRVEQGNQFDVVGIAPVDLESFDIWVDHDTHRISRLVSDGGRQTTYLSDYRAVSGVLVPFVQSSGDMVITTEDVNFEPCDSVSFAVQ